MKIFIRILLPTIAVSIHIRELNSSSEHNEEGSSLSHWFPQHLQGPYHQHTRLFPEPQLEQELHQQHNPQGPYRRHTRLFREPQLEQELHQQQPIQSETPRIRQIPRTPQKRQQEQQQQQPKQQPKLQHEPHTLRRQQQLLQHEPHPLHLPNPLADIPNLDQPRPIQSETPRNRQRERTSQQQARQIRQEEIVKELHQQQPIQSETPRIRQIPRTPQKRQQEQQQQQPKQQPKLQHEPHTLRRQQQLLPHEPHPLELPNSLAHIHDLDQSRPIQSGTPRNRQRERTSQQQARQIRQEEIVQELHQLLEPIHDPQERQRRQVLYQLQLQYPLADIRIIDQTTIINCFDKKIKTSVAIIDDVITTFACELIADPPFIPIIPDITYRKNNIYATVECGINDKIRCIAYVDERAKVFGVKPPPHPNESLRKGNPAKLNPTPSTSFITRKNQVFEVRQNPQSKIVEGIRLLPENRLMSQNNGNNDVVSNRDVVCCGMRFAGHRTENGHIVGASLIANARPQSLYNPNYMPTL